MIQSILRTFLALAVCVCASAQNQNPAYSRAFPAYKIVGNLYYVGTEDLACFLFVTPAGDILVNTGLADSTPLIRASIRSLGFRLEDVKILLTLQGHSDHVGAMSEIQKITGAKVYITEPDAATVESGGKKDPYLNGPGYQYAPFHVDRRLKDGDVVSFGGTNLKVVLTPGHTPGAVTYTTTIEGHSVALTNMETVVMPLVHNAKYPQIVQDYERAFAVQRKLSPEIWVAAHAGQYNMAKKYKAGSFVDPEGYKAAVEEYAKAFQEKLAQERKSAGN